jgi:hypothetical protein
MYRPTVDGSEHPSLGGLVDDHLSDASAAIRQEIDAAAESGYVVSVVRAGDTVATLNQGRPNLIGQIGEGGIEVTTAHSAETVGGARLVPAWLFNDVWVELQQKGMVNRDEVDRQRTRRNIKRSSIVFALLELLPEVEVAGRRPLVLRLR